MKAVCRMVVNVAGVAVGHALCDHHRTVWVELFKDDKPYTQTDPKPDEVCEYCNQSS